MLLFLRTALPSNIFLLPMLPIRSLRFLFCLYALIGSCSNAVLRFEFICNKSQCLLIILLYIQWSFVICYNKRNYFRSFVFDFGAINASLSISDNRRNSVSRNFLLKPRFINDSFNTCWFFENSEISVQIFFRWRAWLYGILVRNYLGWAEI